MPEVHPAAEGAKASGPGQELTLRSRGERSIWFPVTHSFLYGAAVLGVVTRHYRLGELTTCRLLKAGLNDTYLLSTPADKYVVRVYGARRLAEEVSYELELLTHLAARGVPVACAIPTTAGNLELPLRLPEGIRHLVVFEFAPGGQLSWTNATYCQLAGRLLAEIHQAADDFVSACTSKRLDLSYLVDGPLAEVGPFLAHRSGDWAYLERLGSEIRGRVTAARAEGLDWGVCHGDYSAKNIHISGADRVTALDFEYSGPGWRACDFAPVRRLSLDRKAPELWNSFLRGYQEVRRIAAVDLRTVGVFRVLRLLWMLGTFARNVNEWGTGHLSDKSLDGWLGSIRQAEQEIDET